MFVCLIIGDTYLFGVERLMVSVWRYLRGFLRKRQCGAKICCARAGTLCAPSSCNENSKSGGQVRCWAGAGLVASFACGIGFVARVHRGYLLLQTLSYLFSSRRFAFSNPGEGPSIFRGLSLHFFYQFVILLCLPHCHRSNL